MDNKNIIASKSKCIIQKITYKKHEIQYGRSNKKISEVIFLCLFDCLDNLGI